VKSTRIAVLSIWIGAILFFAIAVAPNVFSVLMPHAGGRALAGDIVGRALTALHAFAIVCGILFLLFGLRFFRGMANWLVLAMLALTCLSQFGITPRIHSIRGNAMFESLAPSDPQRAAFDRLHKLSTATEGAVLLLGIVALIAEGRRRTKN
jgi:hypothetical protein